MWGPEAKQSCLRKWSWEKGKSVQEGPSQLGQAFVFHLCVFGCPSGMGRWQSRQFRALVLGPDSLGWMPGAGFSLLETGSLLPSLLHCLHLGCGNTIVASSEVLQHAWPGTWHMMRAQEGKMGRT